MPRSRHTWSSSGSFFCCLFSEGAIWNLQRLLLTFEYPLNKFIKIPWSRSWNSISAKFCNKVVEPCSFLRFLSDIVDSFLWSWAASTAKKNATPKNSWKLKSFGILQANPSVDVSPISLWWHWYLCPVAFELESGVGFWSESTSCPYLACALNYGLVLVHVNWIYFR